MLLSYAGDPLLLVRNDEDAQVAVMCFSLHYSNLPLRRTSPMMRNLFEYFFPSTVDGNSFETEQTVSVNCRGDELTVKGYDTDLTLDPVPGTAEAESARILPAVANDTCRKSGFHDRLCPGSESGERYLRGGGSGLPVRTTRWMRAIIIRICCCILPVPWFSCSCLSGICSTRKVAFKEARKWFISEFTFRILCCCWFSCSAQS